MKTVSRKIFYYGVTLFTLLFGISMPAAASHFELSRLATQISLVSGELASELRYDRGFGSVQRDADRLSRDAEDLRLAISRNRSNSYIRSRFHDVRRRYAELEQEYLQAARNYRSQYAYNSLSQLSYLFSNLSAVYYNNNDINRQRHTVYNRPMIIQRHDPLPRAFQHKQNRSSRDHDARGNRGKRHAAPRISRFDHRSEVLERQRRLDRRHNNFVRSPRYRDTETRRRNHYE